MKIAVFMGGSSPERDVALNSGRQISEALRSTGQDVTVHDVEWQGKDTLFKAVDECVRNNTDVVFLALHGGLGENGGVQGVLEAAGLVYTGSGIEGSAIAMDKHISKKIFRHNGIPTAPWVAGAPESLDPEAIVDELYLPCVVKPVDLGSTIGLTVVRDASDLADAIRQASSYSRSVMVEAYIPGAELTVPVLGGETLPVVEIRPSHEIYDYECKYTSGMSQYFAPAPISQELGTTLSEYALKVFETLVLRDFARIDFRLDAGGIPLCFEANTLPGMTSTSLVPKSARAAGIEFPELVTRIARMALERGHE